MGKTTQHIDLLSMTTVSRMLFIKVKVLEEQVQVYYWIVPDTFLKQDPTGAEVVRYGKVIGKFENEIVAFVTEDYYEHIWNQIGRAHV